MDKEGGEAQSGGCTLEEGSKVKLQIEAEGGKNLLYVETNMLYDLICLALCL